MTAIAETLAFLVTNGLLGAALVAWCRLRLGARLPLAVLLACLLSGPVACVVASAGALLSSWTLIALTSDAHLRLVLPPMLIGPREEAIKLLFALAVAWRDPDVSTSRERLASVVALAIGFAIYEDLTVAHWSANIVLTTAALGFRALGAMPIHALCSLATALAFLRGMRRSVWLVALPLPALVHSVWDTPSLAGSVTDPSGARACCIAVLFGLTVPLRWDADTSPCALRRRATASVLVLTLLTLLCVTEIMGLRGVGRFIAVRPVGLFICSVGSWTMLAAEMMLATRFGTPGRTVRL